MGDYLFGCHFVSELLFQPDESLYPFAARALGVRNSNCYRIANRRVLVQSIINQPGVDLEPGDIGHILNTVCDVEIAVFFHLYNIASGQPAVNKSLAHLRPVANHYLGSANP